jgi:hypothetical protein
MGDDISKHLYANVSVAGLLWMGERGMAAGGHYLFTIDLENHTVYVA